MAPVNEIRSGNNSKDIIFTEFKLHFKSNLRVCVVTILLTTSMILNGCASVQTGTLVKPSPENISSIRKVGLHVMVNKGFGVRLGYYSAADRHWLEQILVDNLGRFYGSLVYGGPIGVFREYSPDREATIKLKPEASPVDSAEAIGRMLLYTFQTNKVFPEIELVQSQSPTAVQESEIDTLFILTVRRWGLRPPAGSKYELGDKAKAELELDVNLKLIFPATGKVLWKRNDLFVDSKSYSLGEFKSQEGLLVRRMGYMLQLVCRRTANEIYRTHQNQGVMQ